MNLSNSINLAVLKSQEGLLYVNEDAIPEELHCPICTEPLLDPVQDEGEHTFCRACITDWLKQGQGACPVGRETIHADHMKPAARMVRNLLDQLKVECYLECDWKGARCELEPHLKNDCAFEKVYCPRVGCKQVMPRRQIKQHLADECHVERLERAKTKVAELEPFFARSTPTLPILFASTLVAIV